MLSGQAITRGFDGYLRASTLAFGGNYAVTWNYGADTRLSTITQSQGSFSASYGYRPSSTLINSVTYKEGSTIRGSVGSAFDAIRRVGRVDTLAGATLVARRDYTYDEANRRVLAEHEDGRKWGYGYDGKGQVISAVKTLADDTPLPGHEFGFTFDDTGNRKTAMINDREESYTPDPLNRYERRTVSGAVDVRGTADADAIILVNELPAVRTGKDFYRAVEVDNRTSPVNAEIKVQAVRLGPPALVGTEVLAVRVETGTLRYAYDKDGNPLGHGLWGYTWDGENRLVAAQISEAVRGSIESLPRYRLEFAYDGFGRRIAKTVKEWNTGSSTWDTIAKTHYLYDGWNLIAELDALGSNTVVRSHVWGIDLSGTPQGAGGVGGLLWSNTSTGTHAPGYDGNGNIIAWIDLGDGTLSGTREYGPFGETLAMTGLAREMPFGFSTKFEDTETKCYYYGFRYYNPSTGRWLNRDPLGDHAFFSHYTSGKSLKRVRALEREALGPLYAFLSNDPLGKVDPTGLDRYITQFDIFGLGGSGGTQLHVGVAVNKWKIENGKYVKDGVATFDFSVDWEDADGDTDWWNIIKGATIGGRGRIVESAGLQLEAPVTMKSSPCQDIKMLEILRKEAQQPPRYVAAFFQCVFWSVGAVQYGMDQPDVEKCCPPAGK